MKSQKTAVIGSGISGLGSALILSENHEVYLFEKENKFGGHSNTITINKEATKLPVQSFKKNKSGCLHLCKQAFLRSEN